ncbi:uncharacterized protein LOC113226389 [Hyposmocoma kahamanoa]|uniref:uncharacterized protein LOC113226389 n=1 Tax=Hyposmocoma kahamanoa TaxID=1477025 RepID=UPI000E6D8D0F|nr:uncharacterized protein LOC113226389 [Hyposmocoma kahamanoa]
MILPTSVFIAFELALLLKPFIIITLKGDVGFRPLDQVLTMASLLVCGVFFVWSLMECYRLIQRIHNPEDELAKQKDMMMVLLRSKHMPTIMIEKVAEYYNYKVGKANIINSSNDLIHSLPQPLTNEIKLVLNERYIRRIPYFSEWHSDIVEWLTLSAHEEFFMTGDIVINVSISSFEGLIVVKAGLLAVYSSDNVETEHLIDGDYFNEMSLFTDCEVSACEVVAITHCQVLLLEKDVFRTLMRKYPNLFYSMRAQLIRK